MKHTQQNQLRMIFWESTARCNLACKHCRRLDQEQSPRELTTGEFKDVLDSAAELGKPVIVFSGGEPLMRDDWQELACYAKQLELPTALATNGTLITRQVAEAIKAADFHRVAISIDAPDSVTHDKFRGQDGAFLRALSGLNELARLEVPRQINITVAQHNFRRLDEMYNIAKRLGVTALHLFMLVPVGCGLELAQSEQLTAEDYERVLGWICDKQRLGEMELRATCGPHYYRVAKQRGMDVRGRGCLGGISVAFISHVGDVFPCGYLPLNCGNVRRATFKHIWNTSEHFMALRDYSLLEGKCGRCEYKTVCGGCRARAYAATGGNYLAEEPFCDYQPDN